MLKIWYWYSQNILQLFRHGKIFYDILCLSTKVAIDFQSCRGVNMGHFEVVLQHIDDSFINSRKQNEEILD
jgi:hypothetical protein